MRSGFAPGALGRRRRRAVASALLVSAAFGSAALGLSGCSGPGPSVFAPDPLDVQSYVGAPCSLLTPARAERRHLQPPGSPVAGDEPGCRWNSTDPRFPSITADAVTSGGLAQLHRQDFSYFRSTEIDRFPAVQTARGPGAPHAGHCSVRVGVADGSRIDVTADYPAVTGRNAFSSDPCADATTLAAEIVNLLAAASP